MNQEIWKPIVGFPRYKISSLGRVSKDVVVLSNRKRDKDGYAIIYLYKDVGEKNCGRF